METAEVIFEVEWDALLSKVFLPCHFWYKPHLFLWYGWEHADHSPGHHTDHASQELITIYRLYFYER